LKLASVLQRLFPVITQFELNSWQFVLDPDPSVSGSFTLTNLSQTTQVFTVMATLGVSPVTGPLSVNGFVGTGTLTEVNGGGATLQDAGVALYGARIDGATVHTLYDPPYLFSVVPGVGGGPGIPVTIPLVSFGPQGLAQSIGSSIGVAFPRFSLTGLDQVQLGFGFDATPVNSQPTPEPGSLLLLGSGLACSRCPSSPIGVSLSQRRHAITARSERAS
jgi:hypothetical protein